MDFWTAFQAIILGVVEGLTEFLPISSTGHQIIVADLIGFGGERAMAFNIIIQLAAILAVVWEFRGKILEVVFGLTSQPKARRFTGNLLLAFMPAVVLGVLFADLIHEYLFNPIDRGDGARRGWGHHALGRASRPQRAGGPCG